MITNPRVANVNLDKTMTLSQLQQQKSVHIHAELCNLLYCELDPKFCFTF